MRLCLVLLLSVVPGIVISQSANARLDSLLEHLSAYEESLYADRGENNIPLGPNIRVTAADYQNSGQRYLNFLEALRYIPTDSLDRQHFITSRLLHDKLQNEVDEVRFRRFLVPMNAEGGFYNAFSNRSMKFGNAQDYLDYLKYLEYHADWLESRMALLKEGINAGIVAPRPVIRNALAMISELMPENGEESVYYAPFTNNDFRPADTIRSRALSLINERILPYYEALYAFLDGEYLAASPEKPGVMFQKDGEAYYDSRIRHFTTLPLTADSVHRLGLQEVERIRRRMEGVMDSAGFTGSFDEFLIFLRTDPQFYARSPEELLSRAAWLSKRAEAGLPEYFSKLYSLPFTVEAVPEQIAPTYTGGRYVPGSWHARRAGIYWVNTYKLDSRPFYTLPALTLHEAVPGHHLQMMLSAELDLPRFRRNYYISAFGEGWGLYSEYLGEEMGMYTTPYEMFGRLTYEMWRACRLVVDTGIHKYGWTRDEAVDFMKRNTALSLHEIHTEIDRYIGWPGQAVSYKVGELKIKALRQKTLDKLGESFDLREFHAIVLGQGSVTLPVLEDLVESYIRDALAE